MAALVGGTLGGWLAHRSQRVNWTRDARMNAYAELMRCYAEAYSGLSREPSGSGGPTVDWSDWNRALAVVHMIAPTPVATYATRIDESLWRFALQAERGRIDNWASLREPLEAAVLEFVNLARHDLGSQEQPLTRLTGRPDPDDPVWTTGRRANA